MTQKSDPARARAIVAVQGVFDRYHELADEWPRTSDGEPEVFDFDCMSKAELLDAGPEGTAAFRFVADRKYANLNGVLHGGACALLFDMFTTVALAPLSRPGYWEFLGGVTRSLNISYLKPVPLGTTILLRSWVAQHGRTMALIRGEMTSEDSKTVYATVDHHKVNVPLGGRNADGSVPEDGRNEKKRKREDLQGQMGRTGSPAKL